MASTYQIKNLKLAAGLNWRTGKPYTLPSEEPLIFEDGILSIPYNNPNEERLPDYLRLDLSAEYHWDISENVDAKFNLALLNVTSQESLLNRRFALEDNTTFDSEINRIEERSLGFTPNFSVQFLF